jgi:hypothetical protein
MTTTARDRIATEAALRRCQMPPVEIGWVLNADDRATVHMIFELHRERLEEELAERRNSLGELEAKLTEPTQRAHATTR